MASTPTRAAVLFRGFLARVLLFLLLVTPFASGVSAQTPVTLHGRLVRADSGEPIAGASVVVAGSHSGVAVTDDNGVFALTPVPPAPLQLIVVLASGQVMKPVAVPEVGWDPQMFELTGFDDEPVVVLGAAPSVLASPASATTMLSATQIAARAPESLMQALETVPGVNQVSEGHAAVPAVRGLSRGRTLLLIDGGRVSSERRVGPSGTFLDPSVIEGIDVARGPGSVAYGSDAIGGVISVRTRRAEPGSPLRGRAILNAGAGIPQARGAFEVSKGFERGGVLLQAHVRTAEDYDSPEGEVFNSGWEDRGFLLNVTHTLGGGTLSAGWQSDFGRSHERPRNNSRTVRFYYPFENSHRFSTGYQLRDVGGFRRLEVTGFLGAYEQRTDQDRFATATAGRSIERADVSARDFHARAGAERIAGTTRIEFGVDVNGRHGLEAVDVNQAFDLDGTLIREATNVSVDNARRINAGVYAQAQTPVGPRTLLSGGIRGDRVTTKNVGGYFGDRTTSNGAMSGFGAVTVAPLAGLTVTAQVSRGFRDPVLSDRYFRGPSGRGFITGNPELDPERSLQFDLGTRYTIDRTQIGVFVYEYRITDLVERYQTETDFFFFRNRGRARHRGFEIEGRSDLGRGYTFEAGLQVARGRALDDHAFLDDVAPVTLSMLGRKDFTRPLYVQGRLVWKGRDTRPGPSEVVAPGATIVDMGGGWRVTPRLDVRGLVRNLLDQRYYASPDPRWVYAPGRSFSLTLEAGF